ncbi:MAG TPA: alpha/beta hydrolase, partial [Acidimicrobiales bacterium]
EWRDQGEIVRLGGHDVFVVDQGAGGPTLVLLHGFPGSSFDWRHVMAALAPRWRLLTCDFLGFGLSAKPDRRYSLFEQADLVEELLAARGVERAALLAHDMGDTVAAELLARANAGEGAVEWTACMLTNGSIFIDMAQLTDGQKLLLSLPDERRTESLGPEAMAAGLAASFPPERPAPDELAAMVALILHDGGDLLLSRTIRYIEERRAHQPRFTAGLVDYPGPLVLAWGDLDPIAVPAMPDRLAELRAAAGNDVELVHWPDIGHWPSVEDPELVAGLVADRLAVS